MILHCRTEAIALHLTLHHIERITGQPQGLAGKSTISRHFEGRDVFARNPIARGVAVHQVLEGEEPDTISLRFTHNRDELAAIETPEHAFVRRNLLDAVDGAGVQAGSAAGLGLKSDTDVFDWARDDGVGNAGKGTGKVVLTVGEARVES